MVAVVGQFRRLRDSIAGAVTGALMDRQSIAGMLLISCTATRLQTPQMLYWRHDPKQPTEEAQARQAENMQGMRQDFQHETRRETLLPSGMSLASLESTAPARGFSIAYWIGAPNTFHPKITNRTNSRRVPPHQYAGCGCGRLM